MVAGTLRVVSLGLTVLPTIAGTPSLRGLSSAEEAATAPTLPSWCNNIPASSWSEIPDCGGVSAVVTSSTGVPSWCSHIPPESEIYAPACFKQQSAAPAQATPNISQTSASAEVGERQSPTVALSVRPPEVPESHKYSYPILQSPATNLPESSAAKGDGSVVLPAASSFGNAMPASIPEESPNVAGRAPDAMEERAVLNDPLPSVQPAAKLLAVKAGEDDLTTPILASSSIPAWCNDIPADGQKYIAACGGDGEGSGGNGNAGGALSWCDNIPAASRADVPSCANRGGADSGAFSHASRVANPVGLILAAGLLFCTILA